MTDEDERSNGHAATAEAPTRVVQRSTGTPRLDPARALAAGSRARSIVSGAFPTGVNFTVFRSYRR